MTDEPDPASVRDARTVELLDRLAEIEDRLDPDPARRGQRIADLVTLAILAPLTLWLGEGLRYPLLLLVLLLGARGLNRLVPFLRNRPLRSARDRMLGSPESPGQAQSLSTPVPEAETRTVHLKGSEDR